MPANKREMLVAAGKRLFQSATCRITLARSGKPFDIESGANCLRCETINLESPVKIYSLWLACFCALIAMRLDAHDDHDGEAMATELLGAIQPQLSRDGGAIAFSYQGAIWRVDNPQASSASSPAHSDAALPSMRRLTTQAGFDNAPCWSPDGSKLAYVNGRGSHIGPLALIDSTDGSAIALPRQIIARQKLAFSIDGSKLLGLFNEQGSFALRWLDLETGNLGTTLQPDSRGLRYALALNGQRIVFSTAHDKADEQGGNNGPQCDIWTISVSGGEPEKLLTFPGRIYDLSWCADNKHIIVVTNLGGAHNDLWQISLEDPLKPAEKITFGQADEDAPSSDAAGRWLLYSDNRRGPTALVVRDLQTKRQAPVTVGDRDFGRPTGRLMLQISDSDAKTPVTARVSLRDSEGKYYAPKSSIYRMLARGMEMHFYSETHTELELPAGTFTLKVSRGPEYKTSTQTITVQAGKSNSAAVVLERWTNQRARNWYSGESHIHANYGYGEWYNTPKTMLAQSAGEDLNVSNFMVANSDSDGVFDREFFRGQPDPLSRPQTILYWNEEFRSTIWGHLTVLNLKHLVEPIFTGFANTTHPHDHPTNADIADLVHDQHGHVNYTHPAHNVKDPYLSAYSAKALPLDVALGKVDSIDVMGSNHEANMQVWYRLLNCGFHVPASAGTDCFLNRVRSRLPGQVRAYVYVEDEFSYQRWIDGLRAGRSFVTDGPMLDFKVNEQLPGSTLSLKEPRELTVDAHVSSQYPLQQFEIVANGEVVHTQLLDKTATEFTFQVDVPAKQTGWLAIRVRGIAPPDQPTGTLFAHSGPIYIELEGSPRDCAKDAQYFVAWIDRLREDIRRRNRIPDRHQVHVETLIAEAREVFQQLSH